MDKEIVFAVYAEGGSLVIERERNQEGERFNYSHSEFDPTDEGLDVNKNSGFKNFEKPFQIINGKYPWFSLHLETVHEDYRNYVIEELIKILTVKGIGSDQLYHAKERLEEVLKINLLFGNLPVRTGMQNITVKFYNGKTIEFEYDNYSGNYYSDSVRSDDLKVLRKNESIDWTEIKCKGIIQVSGSTIIIKNEFNQPIYLFNSAKALVSTSPIISQSKGWYYTQK